MGTTVRVSPNSQSESLQILVNDEDLQPGMPPATYQYILTGLGATIFAVDQRGFVYLNVPKIDADPPNPSTYQLNVEAREVNTVPTRRSEPVTITIHILDINDNSPQFEQPIYMANTTASGDERDVVKVVATDVDSGAFGQVTYTIAQVTNGGEDKFRYETATNMLVATGNLVPGERYQVVIEAIDGGGRSSQAIVIVLALDPMHQTFSSLAPLPGMETFMPNPLAMATTPGTMVTSAESEETIQTFVTEVNENTPPNTVVVSLGDESSRELTYFNVVGGNEEGKFAIDDAGTIVTAEELDREKTAMYSLQVETRSRNPDQHLYWTLVQVTVMDVNDNAPTFTDPQPIRLRLSIDDIEQLTGNMIIGRIGVEDADADDNGRLELRIMPPHNKLFAISNDGILSVNGDFTAAHFGEHDLTVVARDHGEPSLETRARVQISIFGTLITMATVAPTNEVFEYTSSVEEEPQTTNPDEHLQTVTTSPSTKNQVSQQIFSSFPAPQVEQTGAPVEPEFPQFPTFPTLSPHPQIDEETEEDEEVTDEYPDTVATVPTVTVAPDYSEEYGQEASSSSSTILPDVQGVWSEISELPSENPITYTESPITESTAPAPETSPETAPEITPERGSSAENELYPTEIAPENVEKPTELAPDLSETTENTENQWLPDVVETSQELPSLPTTKMAPPQPVPTQSPPLPTPKRLAPVFKPSQITVQIDENESQVEITKAHATYPDGLSGTITYVLHKGDPSLFSVSSYSGSVNLLRALDAETNSTVTIQISTSEAQTLEVDPKLAHFVSITINVADKNDWIPNFESASYEFDVKEDTLPGTIVGQVNAFDQDRDEPNNRIRYRLLSAGGLEAHFNVNAESGLITLARPIDAFAGEKITLRIEGADSGMLPLSSTTTVLINVVATSSHLIPDASPVSNTPNEGELQFSLRNYTASVSEAVRPPHLVQVLSVMNKPTDTRFIICNIISGNYRGAFGITAGNDGNCELRTQMELDRETVERYLLNITVTAGAQTDYALVSITVLDVNDNVPRFVYDSDLGLTTYFGAVSSVANAFTRVLTVKAEDADLGNSSLVNYALDPLSAHSKYFSISPFGEISTKQSMSTILSRNRLQFFEFRVSACDSPISGQQLCSKADVVVNVIGSTNRFKMIIYGLNPQQLKKHEKDLVKSTRQFTGSCNLLTIEKMIEHTAIENQIRTDIYWYAVNPTTKKICKKQDIRKLFETSNVQLIAGKVQPWFRLERISEDAGDEGNMSSGGILSTNWKTSNILLIILAVTVALGAIIGICAVCVFWSRYKTAQRNASNFSHSYPQKLGPIYHPTMMGVDPRTEYDYETQNVNMLISDEDLTMKSGSIGVPAHQRMTLMGAGGGPGMGGPGGPQNGQGNQSYRTYGYRPAHSTAYEGDFSIEESMYAINPSGRLDPITNRVILPSNLPRTTNVYRQS
ncbi:Cadherin domain-containing protein [Caenorhabditis elegans]|uniref:Cadherin domain-containing protein n=1 Tax=Caenorhabditis elegans TaxID=6239 RepID=X5M5L3_CAEEL|nr:Cadherin domain-containing protein [Caenorhabditis elegans]CDO41063.2 Cadherin domain-containing protein [Caenorhabditis elegans]|eukprot:NP_001343703.1 CaDHerin family [Caenorhabditis elegans]